MAPRVLVAVVLGGVLGGGLMAGCSSGEPLSEEALLAKAAQRGILNDDVPESRVRVRLRRAGVTARSCAEPGPGRMDCGPRKENCCISPFVPQDAFATRYDGVHHNDASVRANVSAFRLDKYEVTVGRFRGFVDAWLEGWRPREGAGIHGHLRGSEGLETRENYRETGWQTPWSKDVPELRAVWNAQLECDETMATWTEDALASNHAQNRDSLPINCVTWKEAYAFCIWDGGFLPTDAEWSLAASGGSEQRYYPWSQPARDTSIGGSYASYRCTWEGFRPFFTGNCRWQDLPPVGSNPKGAGKWAHLDLAGSMAEWTLDRTGAGAPNPCRDCVAASTSSSHVVRGGSAHDKPEALAVAARDSHDEDHRDPYVGIRCAREP